MNSLCRTYSNAHKDQRAINLWKDDALKEARAALDAYAAECLSAGFRGSHADAMSSDEWKALLGLPEASMTTPAGLLHRLYLLLSFNLGVRIQEHYNMKREWFTASRVKITDSSGVVRECLTLPIAADKTHQNGIARVGNEDANVAYLFGAPPGTPPELDVMHVLDAYLSHCPAVINNNEPLYLRPISTTRTAVWYTRIGCGKKYLAEILKSLASKVPALHAQDHLALDTRFAAYCALRRPLHPGGPHYGHVQAPID